MNIKITFFYKNAYWELIAGKAPYTKPPFFLTIPSCKFSLNINLKIQNAKETPPGFEPGSVESKSTVITATLWGRYIWDQQKEIENFNHKKGVYNNVFLRPAAATNPSGVQHVASTLARIPKYKILQK